MANITQLYHSPGKTNHEMKDYRGKIFRHRAGQGVKILLCVVLVLGIIGAFWFWSGNKTYEGYEILSSVERTDTLNTQYMEYNGKIIKYSRDGISCVNLKNEAVWSQTYNMQSPIADVCGNSVVVADCQGNEVYVFDAQGLTTQITTLLPIRQVGISAQGVTALLLDDSSAAWIYLYDKEGNELAESRCSLEETGQPISISISSDGTKLAVSYLQVDSGAAGSSVVFYNFGPVGGNFVDKIVSSKIYDDTVIPKIKYLDDSVCAAVSDQGILFYEGKEIPEEKASVEINSEIQSIFFSENRVGIVIDGDNSSETGGESSRYAVCLYDTNGNQVLRQGTDLTYSQAKLSGGNLILYNETECEIYSGKGVLRYSGSFDSGIADMFKGSGLRKYVLVFSDRTEEIKLK